MKNYTLLLLFFLCRITVSGQTNLPMLTKAEMYADYDTLCMALVKINPHNYIRQQVNNYSQTDSILSLRKSIDTIHSTESFFWLVNKALTFCQDGHTSIRSNNTYDNIDSLDLVKWKITVNDTAVIQKYYNLYKETLSNYRLKLPIKYIDGKYLVLVTFKYGNIQIPADAILTKCNDHDIHSYINNLQGAAKNMHWDFVNKRFYTEEFTEALNNKPADKIKLSFEAGGNTISQQFKLSDTVILQTNLKYRQAYEPAVKFFENGNVLYIRMPLMADGDYYVGKIDSIVQLHPIKKIIFDVRDNPGGSDPEWGKVITHIIDKPIIRKIISCGNIENPRRDRWFDTPLPPIKPFYTSFIKMPVYQLVSDEADTLTPDHNGLYFKGKIYILQNENCFSSTGDLISTCQFSDQLINVGNSTGWFGGFGSMPWVMVLPNSKISYWTEPRIDFTNVSKAEDLFHNEVKLTIALTIDDYRKKYTFKGDWYNTEYLYKEDKVFKTVLNLE